MVLCNDVSALNYQPRKLAGGNDVSASATGWSGALVGFILFLSTARLTLWHSSLGASLADTMQLHPSMCLILSSYWLRKSSNHCSTGLTRLCRDIVDGARYDVALLPISGRSEVLYCNSIAVARKTGA